MFRVEIWNGIRWDRIGSSNTEDSARFLLRDTARLTPGRYRLVNPSGRIISVLRSDKPRNEFVP